MLAFYAVGATAPAPETTKGWGVLMQGVRAVVGYVSSGELSAVHNEDTTLSSGLSILRVASDDLPPGKRDGALRAIAALGREIGDLHQAADAFDAPGTRQRLQKLLGTYHELQSFYGPQILGPARKLADVYTCPMHRDVLGKSVDTCRKCGMVLDQAVRIPLFFASGGVPAEHTVRAAIRTEGPLEPGKEARGVLRLSQLTGAPILLTDLRVVHTQRIHLLIIDPSLTDYHHVHPQPTSKPGEYAFSFTPKKAGFYRAWADLRTTYGGFQEYATADISAPTGPTPVTDRQIVLRAEAHGLRFSLIPDKRTIRTGDPVRLKLRITDDGGRPFKQLEPVMATFAHLVGFNEDYQTVLHLHPKGNKTLTDADRGGPDLDFQLYATTPGFYRLFAQIQIGGVSKFVPFGLVVTSTATASK